MKKNGFTLAEVLITLAIIGVVATMTLPGLMSNTQEQQAATGLKKGINTLTEAAQTNNAVAGWDFSTATDDADPVDTPNMDMEALSFTVLLRSRCAIDLNPGVDLPARGQAGVTGANAAVYLRDGTAIYYNDADVVANAANGVMQEDRLPLGYVVYYDTNGSKGPNILSNCRGNAMGEDERQAGVNAVSRDDAIAACTDENRVLRDIYAIRIRGNAVDPEGEASVFLINRAT